MKPKPKDKFVDLEIDGSEGVCPFDKNPCGFVSSCDDVMELALGLVPSFKCSRVVVKFGSKK